MSITPELLEKLSEGKWNPYYMAYALATGAADPKEAFERDGSNTGFFAWNSNRWLETKARLGIPSECPGSPFYQDHLQTLCDCINSQKAAA